MSDVVATKQNAVKPPPLALGINVEKPKFPQYAVCAKRLESFESWPDYLPVKKEDLVEAGLVYTGVGDSVRCFYCGGGLRNWESGDIPMVEHAKWYPKCPHILLVKGQDYIEKVGKGENPIDTDCIQTDSAVSAPSFEPLQTVAAQSCIEMGYCEKLVKAAIDFYIRKNGNTDYKGRDLAEIIETEDNIEDEAQQDCNSDLDSEELSSLLEENTKLKETHTCKICLDKKADVIFLPCGHMASCPQCAPALTKCPICRKTVNGHIKAFFATATS